MTATVLTIDDCPSMLSLVSLILQPEGLKVITASDWRTGLTLAFETRPDLVLLDVEMPGQDGLEMCRRLKSDPRTSEIPVIFLTAASDVRVKVHGFDLGASDYVTKPFHAKELRARVRAALRSKFARDRLAEEAQLDKLTGLGNKATFDDRLVAALSIARATLRPLSLVLLDLDHFKAINDTHGHVFGDQVLRSIGEILRSSLRPDDRAFRYGGEELAVLLPDTPSRAAAVVAERLGERIRNAALVNRGQRVNVTASFGVAECHEIGVTDGQACAFVAAADEALYIAKRSGRDCLRVATSALRHSLPPRLIVCNEPSPTSQSQSQSQSPS